MARLELGPGVVLVTLSQRNLLALLGKLEFPGSTRTIVNGDCYRDGLPVDDVVLVLRVEDDGPHYARRANPPGPMHPATEEFIRERRRGPGTHTRGWGGGGQGRESDGGPDGSAEADSR
jgi:hypothetical protein